MLRLVGAGLVRVGHGVVVTSGRRELSFAARAMGVGGGAKKGTKAEANDRRNRSRRGRPLPMSIPIEKRGKAEESAKGEEEEECFNLYELQGAVSEEAAAEMLEDAIYESSSATEMDIDDCYPQAERDVSFLEFEATGMVRPEADTAMDGEQAPEMEKKQPSARMREIIERFNPKERQAPRKKYPYVSRDVTKCRGCGVTLQSKNEEELGFVPKPKTRKKLRVCRRCWYLQHHNREPPLKEGHRREVLQKDSSTAQLLSSREAIDTSGEGESVTSVGQNVTTFGQNVTTVGQNVTDVGKSLTDEGESITDFATGILDEELRGAVARDVRQFLSSLLPQRMCLVVHVVDLNDLAPESFLSDLSSTIGDNEVMIVGNKADLLPTGTSDMRIREWLRKSAKAHCNLKELPLKNVQLVSSLRGQVKAAVDVMEELRKHRDVFVVGSVNSGKSTFINSVLMRLGIGGVKYNRKYGLTTSNVPGTTLDTISLPLKSGGFLHDTPGLQLHNALPALRPEERKLVIPRKKVKPRIFQLREGKSLYLGGLGRLDYVFGPPMYLSVCASHMLPLHPCDFNDAEEVMDRRLGRDISPPLLPEGTENVTVGEAMDCSDQEINDKKERERFWALLNSGRATELPHMTWREFVFEKGSKRTHESFADIVLPGVGWVSVTGPSTVPVVFHAGVMHGGGPYARAPLMPFEARAAARKTYGMQKHGKLSDYVPPYTKHPSLLERAMERSPFLRERVRKGLPLASPAATHPPGVYETNAYATSPASKSMRGRAKAAGAYGTAKDVEELFASFDRTPPAVPMESTTGGERESGSK